MKIQEHLAGAQVKLQYLGKDHEETFNTEVLEAIEKTNCVHVVCKPITVDGRPIAFKTLGLFAYITHTETDREYRYNVCRCGHFRYKGELLFALFSKDDVEPHNRRNQFRVEFFARGEIQPKENTRVWDCSVHDISFGGIGVNVKKESGFHGSVGENASISFTHPRTKRVYKVNGTISRIEDSKVNNDFYIVGVSIKNDTVAWTGLVASEQTLNIRKQKGLI